MQTRSGSFLDRDAGLRRAWAKYSQELVAVPWTFESQRMQPALAASAWDLPRIEFIRDLADWLGIDTADLFWLQTCGESAAESNAASFSTITIAFCRNPAAISA